MRALIEEIFNCPEATGGLTWAQVYERIETLEKLKRTGARRRFGNMMGAGLLEKNSAGFYLPYPLERCTMQTTMQQRSNDARCKRVYIRAYLHRALSRVQRGVTMQ